MSDRAIAFERMLLRRSDLGERVWQLLEFVEPFDANLRENEIVAAPVGSKAPSDLELYRARLPASFVLVRAGDRLPDS